MSSVEDRLALFTASLIDKAVNFALRKLFRSPFGLSYPRGPRASRKLKFTPHCRRIPTSYRLSNASTMSSSTRNPVFRFVREMME